MICHSERNCMPVEGNHYSIFPEYASWKTSVLTFTIFLTIARFVKSFYETVSLKTPLDRIL